MKMIPYVKCFVLLFVSVVAKKRLVLHSEEDVLVRIAALTEGVETLKKLVAVRHEVFSTPQGSTYTRWGRTQCPGNGTELVYTGYAGGSLYRTTGGAADFVCLSGEPLWGVYDDTAQSHVSRIYGAEYQFHDQFSDGGAGLFGQNLKDHDAPCAVCYTHRSVSIMIPGRNQCYPGWTMEYWGYLVSTGDLWETASNYACLDNRAEVETGDIDDDNGKLIHLVEAGCGTLKCPPYVNNREVTCVVCSK